MVNAFGIGGYKEMNIPANFRGLLYAPSTESELGILFGMILPYIKPAMCVVEGEFQVSDKSWPDVKVKILENKRWRSCRVEFEVKSATFVKHKHNPKDYDMIICWEDNWHLLSAADKIKYKKFNNDRIRISLKNVLENNISLRKRCILNPQLPSKDFYKNSLFIKLKRTLDKSKRLKKSIAKDYISYYCGNISFIQLRIENERSIQVYISRRGIEQLRDPEGFLEAMKSFNPSASKSQQDLAFTLDSIKGVNNFISLFNKYL